MSREYYTIENLKKIWNHYGFDNQINKLEEELIELLHAIKIYKKTEKTSPLKVDKQNDMEREMADVSVLISQYDSNITSIKKDMRYKIKRQLERIENEK